MLSVDVKFANLLGPRLRNFKRKSEYLWNYSCCVCGDSKKNKLKARGYIYRLKTGLVCKCHNCGYSTNLGNLIKYVDPVLYQEYALEVYKEGGAPRSSHSSAELAVPEMFEQSVELSDSVLEPLKRLDKLSLDHPAVKYVVKRKIPHDKWNLLYFATRFKHYVNSVIPNKFPSMDHEHPRLIIPYFTNAGKCFAFQGRAFGPEDPKYMTIKVDDTREKIYGLDRIDYSKPIYIVEGPLDSLFLPNCVAVSGSTFDTPTIRQLATNAILVYDNEPRSPELTKLIKKSIDADYKVCLWPDTVEEKDINDMVKAGKTVNEILDTIKANTYSGAEAQLRYAAWRKC